MELALEIEERFSGVLPAQWLIFGILERNRIAQMLRPAISSTFVVQRQIVNHAPQAVLIDAAGEQTLVFRRGRTVVANPRRLSVQLRDFKESGFPFKDPQTAKWESPRPEAPAELGPAILAQRAAAVGESWAEALHLRSEGPKHAGLRPPQLGAVYAVLAHWTLNNGPCTVVLPTGTGKTDTMIALMIQVQMPRVLVLVPSDPLREQISKAFSSLGWLSQARLIGSSAAMPIVGTVERGFADANSATQYIQSCNVTVTTAALLARASAEVKRAFQEQITHVFVDEAHHVPAATWISLREDFSHRPIVQFTATPFREDGKLVDGQVVYRFPSKKAQAEGYFSKIDFRPVNELLVEEADAAIVAIALAQLRTDLSQGDRHLMMARASSIARAEQLFENYLEVAGDLGVVLLTSKTPMDERRRSLEELRAQRVRVVVCVDMLGEGVDLPALKIAALHDAHRSLAITLQFVGRFTRTGADRIGGATIVANIGDVAFQKSLSTLYSEDSDWNVVLSPLSDATTSKHVRQLAYAADFASLASDISIQNIAPKMSVTVFKTGQSAWNPERADAPFASSEVFVRPMINSAAFAAAMVLRKVTAVDWGDIKDLRDVAHHLYLLHFDPATRLLYVFSSEKGSSAQLVADAVLADDAVQVHGEPMFRVFNGLRRIQVMSVGLKQLVNRRIQFQMSMGRDLLPAFTDVQQQNRSKSNLFGFGYQDGKFVGVGCSQKGLVWSTRVAKDVEEWSLWAREVGAKLIDDTIETDELLKHVVLPEAAVIRPASVPICVEWNLEFEPGSEASHIRFVDELVPFTEVELRIARFEDTGPLTFAVVGPGQAVDFEVIFTDKGVRFVPSAGIDPLLISHNRSQVLSEWFLNKPPRIRFADGSFMQGDDLFKLFTAQKGAFDRERIQAWDWTGVDLSIESFGPTRIANSIQARVFEELKRGTFGDYLILFNDDNSGEIADIVGLRRDGVTVFVDLFHLKYATDGSVGTRVGDLYEVCGQAEKSTHWCRILSATLDRLRKREIGAAKRGWSRFERGDRRGLATLLQIASQCDAQFRVFLVSRACLARRQHFHSYSFWPERRRT